MLEAASEKPSLFFCMFSRHLAFVILLLVFAATAESFPQNLTWPTCPNACGDLKDIPYPFGIGFDCSLSFRFEIDCQQTRGISTPVLKNLNLLELNISLPDSYSPGLIKISQPISYSHINCTANQRKDDPVDLKHSLFRYSKSRNYFVSGGCNTVALMADANTPWVVVGCKSSDGKGGRQSRPVL
ncbi:hypothetical protein ACJRO7_001261 [Eucalyptus globulus]|uniref:Wall-associated receptor kinase galacturonan-binding domain-containing protein n=1 Tax=Eucalyptus globulus TaxID=34317 RepID=A0ABD3LUC3_EUCGL